MRNRIAAIAVGTALVVLPASAIGAQREINSHQLAPYEKRYEQLRDHYVKEFGLKSAGRDIVRDGRLTHDGHVREATHDEVRSSADRMEAALNSAEPTTTTTTDTTAATTSTYSSTPSSTVACESGGDYGAVNPAGYYGAYQFDQSTWDAYAPSGYQGTNPASAPPGVQDAAAANVPYDAWPSCP
jgi:hypothetical protein